MNYLSRLLDYEEKEEICGPNRNSYYKTDHDATAMALKTDYYSGHGSNMHAAYNVQFLVSAGIITFFGVFQDRTDYHTLIPLLKEYHSCYSSYPDNLCADSGYGIEDNYEYLSANGIGNYIKFLNWNGEKSAEYPQLFFPDPEKDVFYCLKKWKDKNCLLRDPVIRTGKVPASTALKAAPPVLMLIYAKRRQRVREAITALLN